MIKNIFLTAFIVTSTCAFSDVTFDVQDGYITETRDYSDSVNTGDYNIYIEHTKDLYTGETTTDISGFEKMPYITEHDDVHVFIDGEEMR